MDDDKKTEEKNEKDSPRRRVVYPDIKDAPCILKEPEAAYAPGRKRQGEYTIEDYYALPEGTRAELIDGTIYFMASPTIRHELIGKEICETISQHIKKNRGRCIVLDSTLDVHLFGDDTVVVQPDVLVICNQDKIRDGVMYGAPDFVVEVMSPSTGFYDRTLKLRKYREAGVRECWLIDQKRQEVEVYVFRDRDMDVLPKVYRFEDVVPVGIFDGECKVDFAEMMQYIDFLYSGK
ncbi:MAG: Uma2 family endonuclease [Lachnospiraceae bacterium]|nr:Uma2 family endonuclease [Lachnospiraceae bacterium]